MVETADTQLIDEQFRCVMAELDEALLFRAAAPVASRPYREPDPDEADPEQGESEEAEDEGEPEESSN